jgi:1-(5-phosphoribosyl)-5-[(5-phosphoribosylamino)methylideneamino] imidazole-4-carboxamide isomerase/N-(5'phosphoribosyl)anthranilate isomerase
MTLELLPAVDLLDGQAARLVQGVAGTETGYGDPVEAATGFAVQGARWLHVVDLDAAFGRGPRNREHLGRIVAAVGPVQVEASGGVRTADDLHALLELGAARVVIGTAALEDPEWVAEACARHGEAVAVGLDARGRTLQARGWTASGGDLFEVLQRLEAAGCRRFVHTEVARDGMLTGPATDRLAQVLAATSRPVIASGGVATLDDLRALATLEPSGLEGAIVGKALYAGRFTVTDALATLAEEAPNLGARPSQPPGTRASQPPDVRASQPPGARASQPPVAGAPEREGSRRGGGAGGAVHSPPTHPADGGAG